MAIIDTGLTLHGAKSEFFRAYDETAAMSVWPRLCATSTSDTDIERYRWLDSLPMLRPWGSGRLAKGIQKETYDVENIKYELTIEVDRDELADDQTGQIERRIAGMGARAASHKDYLLAQLITNGYSAGYIGYDGQIFFSGAHPIGAGSATTFDNDLTANIAAVAYPTDAEFLAAYTEAMTTILNMVDDQGMPLHGTMSGFKIIVPPNMAPVANRLMNAEVIGTAANTMRGTAEVIVFPWLLTGSAHTTDTWYLAKVEPGAAPFIFQDRESLEFGELASGSEEEFKREKYLYGVRARYAMTYMHPQNIVRYLFT